MLRKTHIHMYGLALIMAVLCISCKSEAEDDTIHFFLFDKTASNSFAVISEENSIFLEKRFFEEALSPYYSSYDTLNGLMIGLDTAHNNLSKLDPYFTILCLTQGNSVRYVLASFDKDFESIQDTFSFISGQKFVHRTGIDSLDQFYVELSWDIDSAGIVKTFEQYSWLDNEGIFHHDSIRLSEINHFQNALSGEYYLEKDSFIYYLKLSDHTYQESYDFSFTIATPENCKIVYRQKDKYLQDSLDLSDSTATIIIDFNEDHAYLTIENYDPDCGSVVEHLHQKMEKN